MEATGLGGRDLLYSILWNISIRSDKEGQSIYGPSLAPMQENVDVPGIFGGTETVQVTALGRSKAAHEFLVLHYLDWIAPSIEMHSCLSSCRQFSSQVPQSVGLLLWKCLEPRTLHCPTAEHLTCCGPTQMILIWNLLMGGRMGRYTDSPNTLVFDQHIHLKDFCWRAWDCMDAPSRRTFSLLI